MASRYKVKMRKSTRYVFKSIGIIMLIISLLELVLGLSKNNQINTKQEIYSYEHKFSYDYDVNLIDNNYIKDSTLGSNYVAYVTDLIDTIDLDLVYEYNADQESVISYSYNITGHLRYIYTNDGEEQKIIDEEETLVEDTPLTANSNNFKIDKKLKLDLKEKNRLVNNFEQEMGMTIEAKYVITLNISANTNIEGKDVSIDDDNSVEIDVASKTTKITSDNENGANDAIEYVTKDVPTELGGSNVSIVIEIIFIIVAIGILRYVSKTKNANLIRNEYKQEVNRILRVCRDKIVKLDTKPNEQGAEIINVRDFGEIIKLSEELFKPILYWEDKENEESCFMVISHEMIYKYILKR